MRRKFLFIFVLFCLVLKVNSCLAFERDIKNSTGWGTVTLYAKGSVSSSSTLYTIPAGKPFLILGESGNYFEVLYDGKVGFVDSSYCMINLPDVIPSIVYEITNAGGSIYRSSGYDISGVTGVNLYNSGKVWNEKLGYDEYISPVLYSTAKIIDKAQQAALRDGFSLMIYDSYRPRSVSSFISSKLGVLYNGNSVVRRNIDYSVGRSGARYYWGRGWFLASGLSSHNTGAAIDVTLYDLNNHEEVLMPTAMHELSTAAIKYYSGGVASLASNYSVGMLNNVYARKLDQYMTNAGMTTLASEWWHFQDQSGYNRVRYATFSNGCDFYPKSIVSASDDSDILSSFPDASSLTTVGDLNNDGKLDDLDAKLIKVLYDYLKDNVCSHCDSLIYYADVDGSGQVDVNDIFTVLSRNNLITSSKYDVSFDRGYIYTKTDAYKDVIDSNIKLNDVLGVSHSIVDDEYIIKYDDLVIKEFDLVYLSSDVYDLSHDYVLFDRNDDVVSNVEAVNSRFVFSGFNDGFVVLYDDYVLDQFGCVSYSSDKYDLSGSSIGVVDSNIQSFLANIDCSGCEAFVFDGWAYVTEGIFSLSDELVIMYHGYVIKRFSLFYPVSGVIIDADGVDVSVDSEPIKLNATVISSLSVNHGVRWFSSDSSVVSVSSSGLLTFNGVGSAVITVVTDDGDFIDTCEVYVRDVISYNVTYVDGDETYVSRFKPNQLVSFKDDLVRDGYRLVGYSYDGKMYGLSDSIVMPDFDITLTAIWEEILVQSYNVTYVVDDCVYNEIFSVGSLVSFRDDFVKEGYKLVGYSYDNKTYGLSDSIVMPDSDITLTAVFEPISYQLPNVEIWESFDYQYDSLFNFVIHNLFRFFRGRI